MKEFAKELLQLKNKQLLRTPACIESYHGSKISIDGKTFVNFSSNDYLGLAHDPKIVNAAVKALKSFGLGTGSSRLLSGTTALHERLEDRIAKFKGTEAAIAFSTGYAANTGVIPAISDNKMVIFSDELNHASIIDGIRLSDAKKLIFHHKDMDHLERLMKKSLKFKDCRQRLIITDTVFSMDGDIAPVHDILFLCEKYDSLLMIDDAHGTGVIGKRGRGALEHFNIKNTERIIQMGTLSKALGCFGAFIAGSKDLIQLLTNRARSFIYSTSFPPAVAEAAICAIDIVEHESEQRRGRLWQNSERLRRGLQKLGFDTLDSETPIVPVLIGKVKDVLRTGTYLYRNKIFAPAIRPPTVAEGRCRIRLSVTAMHSKHNIDSFIDVIQRTK